MTLTTNHKYINLWNNDVNERNNHKYFHLENKDPDSNIVKTRHILQNMDLMHSFR